MGVSLKCQYGLRALFELSRRWGEGLVRIPEIAEAQAIPLRFLENILNQLRQGGFVESRRGKGGGFVLSRPPSTISLAQIVTFIDGEIFNLDCEGDPPLHHCRLRGSCVFLPVWREARAALQAVYEGKTLQDLLEADLRGPQPDYCI
ncbi:MAG: Rrf2 family transcriptional regulator [Desulfovibrio sp.]|jgi:Rrf2 family protein|nr:Rrf2 family transcriptional regulator [Desulfovibrio sp.]